MTAAAIKDLCQFFREFIVLCLSPNWPDNGTEPEQIRKVLEASRHIQLSVEKMKSKKICFDNFLDLLCTDQNFTKGFLQYCMADPPKFILKKIIISDCDIMHIDVVFQNYIDLFSEDKLNESFSELLVEAASKETLLRNMKLVLPHDRVQEINNHLYLFIMLECDSDETIVDVLKGCNQDMIDSMILCLVHENMTGLKDDNMKLVKRKIITGFTNLMSCRDSSSQLFWKLFFSASKENLNEMLLKYNTLCEMAFDALKDSYGQIQNDLDSECYYINLTTSQLHSTLSKIFGSETLKSKFYDYMTDYGFNDTCLQNLLKF